MRSLVLGETYFVPKRMRTVREPPQLAPPTLFGPTHNPAAIAPADGDGFFARVWDAFVHCMPHGAGVPSHLLLGMNTAGMRGWLNGLPHAEAIGKANKAGATQIAPDYSVARDLNGYVALHASSSLGGQSVCERIWRSGSKNVGHARIYVSWPLSMPMSQLIDALETYLARHPELAPNDTFFWVSVLSMRPPSTLRRAADITPRFEGSKGKIGAVAIAQAVTERTARDNPDVEIYWEHASSLIALSERLVLVLSTAWQDPACLSRAHCIHEVALAVKAGTSLELTMARWHRTSFDLAYNEDIGQVRALLGRMANVDVRSAHTKIKSEQKHILREAMQWQGSPPIEGPTGGVTKYNAAVRTALRQAVLQQGRLGLATVPIADRGKSRLVDSLGIVSKELELANCREQHGGKSEKTLSVINNLACLLKRQGCLEAAGTLYREALKARRSTLGDKHPQTLVSMSNLGAQLYAQGKLNEASVLMNEALEMRRATLGAKHPSTLTSAANMGNVLKQKGDVKGAAPLLKQALEGRREALGPTHPQTLRSMNNMAGLHYDLDEMGEAETLYREALDSCRACLGNHDPLTITSMSNLGNLLHTRGFRRKLVRDLEEAVPLLREAVELSTQSLGAGHVDTLISRSNLGACLRTLGQESEAKALIRGAVEGINEIRKGLGDGHPHALALDSGMDQLEA